MLNMAVAVVIFMVVVPWPVNLICLFILLILFGGSM